MGYLIVTRKVSFEKPVIGARDYVTVSGAGWPESFSRKECDERLTAFVSPLKVSELLDNFAEHVELNCRGYASWTDVTGYLGRIAEMDPDKISCQVGIAFWAQLVLRETTPEVVPQVKVKGKKAC